MHSRSLDLTLEPGELISTGTLLGAGLGVKPPHSLREGDVIELAIERLGAQWRVEFRHASDTAEVSHDKT
jgi:2-keto-4-pentenoate hydratase/2-oxohepta-3-ene-1,7-dioic acid hydratase in catechol pathway